MLTVIVRPELIPGSSTGLSLGCRRQISVEECRSQTGGKLRNRKGIKDAYLTIAFLGDAVLVVQTHFAEYWQLVPRP
jgi:hypothetical protein